MFLFFLIALPRSAKGRGAKVTSSPWGPDGVPYFFLLRRAPRRNIMTWLDDAQESKFYRIPDNPEWLQVNIRLEATKDLNQWDRYCWDFNEVEYDEEKTRWIETGKVLRASKSLLIEMKKGFGENSLGKIGFLKCNKSGIGKETSYNIERAEIINKNQKSLENS